MKILKSTKKEYTDNTPSSDPSNESLFGLTIKEYKIKKKDNENIHLLMSDIQRMVEKAFDSTPVLHLDMRYTLPEPSYLHFVKIITKNLDNTDNIVFGAISKAMMKHDNDCVVVELFGVFPTQNSSKA